MQWPFPEHSMDVSAFTGHLRRAQLCPSNPSLQTHRPFSGLHIPIFEHTNVPWATLFAVAKSTHALPVGHVRNEQSEPAYGFQQWHEPVASHRPRPRQLLGHSVKTVISSS